MKFSQEILGKIVIQSIIIGTAISLVASLQLEGLSTKKPRSTKYTLKPTAPTSPPSTVSLYRINATSGGATCILIQTDGLLSIQYRDKLNEDREVDVYLPDFPGLAGECDSDESSITLSFKGFVLSIAFEKSPGGERWFINDINLAYSSSNPIFEHIDRPGLNVKLATPPGSTFLFPTPVGKSFLCDQEQIIVMFSQDEDDKSGHLAKLYLRETRMQSFMYKAGNAWGPPYQCTASGTYRDESAPLFVGSTLAFAAVCTVAGYSIFRYMKVKKPEYGAMGGGAYGNMG